MIDGSTQLTGIVGHPLTYTLSPLLHNTAFREAGLNWRYLPFPIEEAAFDLAIPALEALGFAGANVTIPFKERAVVYVDDLEGPAAKLKAVNTLLFSRGRVIGYNTDGAGFLSALEDASFRPDGKRAVIAGAGGAGKAAALALAAAGAAKIYLVNRSPERARGLQALIERSAPSAAVELALTEGDLRSAVSDSDLVVNATPVGMTGHADETGLANAGIRKGQLVYDLVYWPPQTPLLKEAGRVGAARINGLEMLLYQAAEAFTIWTGQQAPIQRMRAALTSEVRRRSAVGESP
ncbi:MAG: shikimate dehydrogenase [Terriglobia bacterium]